MVADQNYDVMFSFILVDEEGNQSGLSTIPEGRNYRVEVTCNNGAIGTWDYETWGPFANITYGSQTRQIGLWYQDEAWLVYSQDPWFPRGLQYSLGMGAGLFAFCHANGSAYAQGAFRIVQAF